MYRIKECEAIGKNGVFFKAEIKKRFLFISYWTNIKDGLCTKNIDVAERWIKEHKQKPNKKSLKSFKVIKYIE